MSASFPAGSFTMTLVALLSLAVVRSGADAVQGEFLTSHMEVKTFSWTGPKRTVSKAIDDAFPQGFQVTEFIEGRRTNAMDRDSFTSWIEQELLQGPDPFAAHGGRVPLPWPQGAEFDNDQLGPGHFVTYSRRQLCFIVAQSLIGAGTDGYANGLLRYLEKAGYGGCLPRTGDFGRSLITFLETCWADPSLQDGGHGPVLIVAKAEPSPDVQTVRDAGKATPLSKAGLRVCQYDDGAARIDGVKPVPNDGCQQPIGAPGRDFMTGGLQGQGTQDISAAFLGGYVFGNACGLGGGQDERLMTYMPEVGALTFFLSQDWERPQLRQPAWILGARMLFDGLDGTARFNDRLQVKRDTPLTGDLREVELAGKTLSVDSSRPFIAFQSENQGYYPWDRRYSDTPLARRNRLAAQREVSPSSWFAFDKQVRAWYRSVALTSYHQDVRPALKTIVSSLGTGPWLAGLWWGDSQLGFLAVWLGHAIAAPTWGDDVAPIRLDYYIYSAFTESPGSQCFVHSRNNCQACVATCMRNPLPRSSYWMPDEAYFSGWQSCVPYPDDCGEHGLEHIVRTYGGGTAADLWVAIESALSCAGGATTRTVFDEVLAHRRLGSSSDGSTAERSESTSELLFP